MKPHQIIAPWKGDTRFTAIAKEAARLKKAGADETQIREAIIATFGKPAELLGLRDEPAPAHVFGVVRTTNTPNDDEGDIEPGAYAQLHLALRLPIAERGALMPDAHQGYALPIGGVFRAYNSVSPAMVGVDIACRMMLTIFEAPPAEVRQRRDELFRVLKQSTTFGAGAQRPYRADHEVLEDARWGATSQLRSLRDRAAQQLGTSGAGNHFAELVVGETLQALIPGAPTAFAGLLTHSGSRGVGYAIANQYMRIAEQETKLIARVPKMYEWLDVDSEAGAAYWTSMELAGAFASANHHVIHQRFARLSGLRAAAQIENHHNFAWRDGPMVIHRKGATPAEAGVLGLIPGSMATNSYVVVGTGNAESLMSTSHGAGRRGSRTWARTTISMGAVRRLLAERDVLVEGVDPSESPFAYKDIERVIAIQEAAGLLERVARMQPIAVLMAGEPSEH